MYQDAGFDPLGFMVGIAVADSGQGGNDHIFQPPAEMPQSEDERRYNQRDYFTAFEIQYFAEITLDQPSEKRFFRHTNK